MSYLSVTACVLFSAMAWSQNSPPRPAPEVRISRPPNQEPQGTQSSSSSERRGSEESPFIIKVLPPEDRQNEPRSNSGERPSNPSKFWGLSDKIAVIASIVAFLQFLALVWTVVVMILNGRRQLRAYVLLENVGIWEGNMLIPPQPNKADIPGISMLIKNCGQTPAYKVVSWANIAVIPVRDEKISLAVPPIEEHFSNTLGSSSTFNKHLWFDRPLTANEIADIATGERAIYLYGRIEYQDAFKKKRFTNFRLRYNGYFPPQDGAILTFSETGNHAN